MKPLVWGLFIDSIPSEMCMRGEQGGGHQVLDIIIYHFSDFQTGILKRNKSANKEPEELQ